jgi:anaerobic dimethyl sulfoxide reductase subunit B (iron-sulfur subunit)
VKEMASNGLWIDIEFCTGCLACEVACRYEHGFAIEEFGIKVVEQVLNGGQTFNFVPIPTDLCDLCVSRTAKGNLKPACVQHCLAQVMEYGKLTDLVKRMEEKPRSTLWSPKPRKADRKPFASAAA